MNDSNLPWMLLFAAFTACVTCAFTSWVTGATGQVPWWLGGALIAAAGAIGCYTRVLAHQTRESFNDRHGRAVLAPDGLPWASPDPADWTPDGGRCNLLVYRRARPYGYCWLNARHTHPAQPGLQNTECLTFSECAASYRREGRR